MSIGTTELLRIPRSNCTFMELKCRDIRYIAKQESSNCTFMELKYHDSF